MSEDSSADNVPGTSFFWPGIKPEEVKALYDEWSNKYDEMIADRDYQAPETLRKEVQRLVPPEKRAETKVLDVAAGTGLIGQMLYKEGFRHIDAVDPSEGMMKKLEECGVYTNKFMEPIGTGESTLPKETYDLVVISGGMCHGHIPVSGLDDLVRVTKKGGLVIIIMRYEFLETVAEYKDKLENYMDGLEEDGIWRKVERRIFPNNYLGKDGIIFVFQVI